jgi:hypothetical protein
MPHRVHTMRGPNVGTGTSSGHGSALKIARWWHSQQHTSSDRTPLARMLPRVIGSAVAERGRVVMLARVADRSGGWKDAVTAMAGAGRWNIRCHRLA